MQNAGAGAALPRGILRAAGAVCGHGGGRLHFAPEVKTHDGLLAQHAAFDALVHSTTAGELAPGVGRASAPGRDEVIVMSEHVFGRYAQGSPVLCAQLLGLSDDLVAKLTWAKQADDAAAAAGAFRPAAVPVLGGGGGSTARLRSAHLPAAVFMQMLLRLACTLHPAY